MAKKAIIVEGIKVKIDPAILEDFEVLEIFAEMQEPVPEIDESASKAEKEEYNKTLGERGMKAIRLVSIVLGDQKDMVIKTLRERNNGIASSTKVMEFVSKIVESSAKAKK